MMTPEPWPPRWPDDAVMLTTLGETAAAVADQSGDEGSDWLTGAASVPACCDAAAAEGCASSAHRRDAATVPPEERRAARTATVVISAVRRRPARGASGRWCPVGPNGPEAGVDPWTGMGAVACRAGSLGVVVVPPGVNHWGVGFGSLMAMLLGCV